MPPQPGIEVTDLTKTYADVVAVDGLNLSIEKGELFGLLGPNGSGKTTTINCLCGLVRPTKGTLKVRGFDVLTETGKVRAILGISPQETAVYSHLSGRENIEFFGSLYSRSKRAVAESADSLLKRLGLEEDADRRVAKYSGGMKRRVSIAMALVQDPEVIFLDEPTVTMDPQSRRAMWEVIRELKTRGKTVVLTTHYIEEADALCDRVGVIDRGRLIELGTPEALKAKHGAKTLEDVFLGLTGRTIREGA